MTGGGGTAKAPFDAGDVVGMRYRVDGTLGAGSFGWVLAAHRVDDAGAKAALKVLRPEQIDSAAGITRFVRRELEILKRVHASASVPQVVRAMEPEIVEERGALVMVLELVDGPALADVIEKERVLDQGEARAVLLDLAKGLAAIHEAGGVHRDLKPDNVRLRPDGSAVILDLGIAKAMWNTHQLTGSSQAPMTPLYASPEQLVGEEVGPPADVYALGLIGYEMLAGAVPLVGRSLPEIIRARDEGRAPDVGTLGRRVAADLSSLVARCLSRSPRSRPSAKDIVATLGGALADTLLARELDDVERAATQPAPLDARPEGSSATAGRSLDPPPPSSIQAAERAAPAEPPRAATHGRKNSVLVVGILAALGAGAAAVALAPKAGEAEPPAGPSTSAPESPVSRATVPEGPNVSTASGQAPSSSLVLPSATANGESAASASAPPKVRALPSGSKKDPNLERTAPTE